LVAREIHLEIVPLYWQPGRVTISVGHVPSRNPVIREHVPYDIRARIDSTAVHTIMVGQHFQFVWTKESRAGKVGWGE
jgi:hypothetical protein